MADILIRMEMPKTCADCYDADLPTAISWLGAKCPWANGIIDPGVYDIRHNRHPDCPLVELPEHGDLISLKDAKTVIDRFIGYLDEEMIYRIKYKLNQDCPVVIPASKEETE